MKSLRLWAVPVFAFLLPVVCFGADAAARAAGAADGATITFRKVFRTSYPEFVEIKISETGAGTYDIRALDEAPSPQAFQTGTELSRRIFSLAAKLHNFQGVDLAVHRRIANLGEKTFRWERGGEVHEATFNYTLDDSATQLLNIFEGLTRQETGLADLQRTMRYDRLGVGDVLAQIEADYNGKLLPEPERLLASLDQLSADAKFIDLARQRARTLASRIRSGH